MLVRIYTTYIYVVVRTTTYYYVLLRATTCYYVLLRTTTYYYVLLHTTTYYYVRLRTTTYHYVLLHTTTYYIYVLLRTTYTWLQMVLPPQPTDRGGAGTLCVHVVALCADLKIMSYRPCLDTYIHTYKQTINQYKQIVIIHKSIETYSYTYTWLQMVRPPQPTHRGGGGGKSLCADTKTMTCRPCCDTHILT